MKGLFYFIATILLSPLALESKALAANPIEGAILVLGGQDAASREPCFLYVLEVLVSESDPANSLVKLTTSYSHDGEAAEPFLVSPLASSPLVLTGIGENGEDQLAVFLFEAGGDLTKARAFNLKWLHGNHFHTNKCLGLKPIL